MTNPNEGAACDAVVRLMEQRTGVQRSNVFSPERRHENPPVDLRFQLGAQTYAMEHTRIEAFQGQIELIHNFRQLTSETIDQLSGNLPGPAVYQLIFPQDPNLRLRRRRLNEARENLLRWIEESARQLHDRNPDAPTQERYPQGIIADLKGTPDGFPDSHELILKREAHWSYSERFYGVLTAHPVAPDDLEKQRTERLRRTLNDKCPKLDRCRDGDTRTILVLEDGDMILSNHILIETALAKALGQCDDRPDEIYLVETSINPWAVRAVKIGNRFISNGDWQRFDAADLVDLMRADDENGAEPGQ